ncbi:type IV pilin protein [Halonatronum saccharophilum]|uniref:type IV pilin protein n=1 Tax=Halonatronum saccharophilum TaxID=150060 RepID=UPI0004BBF7E8|nr:type II secretion system protein [Halonatronum saccharophilum]
MISKVRGILKESFSREEGFTLIELMIVIAVLGILAGIAIPNLSGVTNRAEEAEIVSLGGPIRTAMEMYKAQHGNYPEEADNGVVEHLKARLNRVGMGELITQLNESDATEENSITYEVNDDDYYIEVEASNTDNKYYIGPDGVDLDKGEVTDL